MNTPIFGTISERYLLIDGDMLAMRAMTANEHEHEFPPGVWTRWADTNEALVQYHGYTRHLQAKAGDIPDHLTLHFFSSGTTFRHMILPGYKGGRGPKPIGYNAFIQRLRDYYGHSFRCLPFVEADDCISIEASLVSITNDRYVIASGDKDMRQIPGEHVWLDADLETISEADAAYIHARQWLMGDSTDKIPGIKGMGITKAERALKKHGTPPEAEYPSPTSWISQSYNRVCFAIYQENDCSIEYATLMRSLVTLLNGGEYDFACQMPKIMHNPRFPDVYGDSSPDPSKIEPKGGIDTAEADTSAEGLAGST